MIDWNASAEFNNCTIKELKSWFKKYPKSGKKVVRICDICGEVSNVDFRQSGGLCSPCRNRTPEHRKGHSIFMIEHHKNHPEMGKAHSDFMIEYCADPEVIKGMSNRTIQYHINNPDAGHEHSERLKKSDACKMAIELQRGGNDIIQHHYLYDDADLSKYTMPMTRSDHTRMHNYMREDGYEVPHINSATDDNGLWGYH